MANKYLIHGATYCGDGTASNEAASAGAAGAWNDINVFEGASPAYGSLDDGDVVFIRSKTSAGADITRTLTASITLGSSNATTSAWIRWVLDGGEIWDGVNGILTYSCPSSYVVGIISYNDISCAVQDALVIYEASTANTKTYLGTSGKYILSKLKLDLSNAGVTSGNGAQIKPASAGCVYDSLHVVAYKAYEALFRFTSSYGHYFVRNPDIELLTTTASPIFEMDAFGKLDVFGGRIYGDGAIGGTVCTCTTDGASARLVGLEFPQLMTTFTSSRSPNIIAESSMIDGSVGGDCINCAGQITSRTDAYYPALNANVPEQAGELWSWMMYPDTALGSIPLEIKTSKLFVDAAAVKTITTELLVGDTFAEVDANSLWVSIGYTDDSTGKFKHISSKAISGAFQDSTAGWSSDTYGAVLFDRKKIVLTTPTAIKQYTAVHIAVACSAKANTAQKLIIVCPDMVIS